MGLRAPCCGERDVNEQHELRSMFLGRGCETPPAEKLAKMMSLETIPDTGAPFMINYGDGPNGIILILRRADRLEQALCRSWETVGAHCDEGDFIQLLCRRAEPRQGSTDANRVPRRGQ